MGCKILKLVKWADHIHLGDSWPSESQYFSWSNRAQNLALAVSKIFCGVQNSEVGHVTPTTPLLGTVCHRQAGTCYDKRTHQI